MNKKGFVFAVMVIIFTFAANTSSARTKHEQRELDKQMNNAIVSGNYAKAEELIAEGGNVNSYVAIDGERSMTSLHRAALHGKADIAQLLIDHGADVNAMLMNRGRPIHYAAMNGHTDAVKVLIRNGADPSVYSRACGGTPAMIAEWLGYDDLTLLLLKPTESERSDKADVN